MAQVQSCRTVLMAAEQRHHARPGNIEFPGWAAAQPRRACGVTRMIQEAEMPPAIYLPMHPSVHLTAVEELHLITGLTIPLKPDSRRKHS